VDRRRHFHTMLLGIDPRHVSISSYFQSLFLPPINVRITKHEHSDEQMTSVWVFPIITLIVASSGGGQLAQALYPYSVTGALTTLAFAIFMVSVGIALAFMVLTIYLHRLILHGFPPGVDIVSSFIPLGPTGQAGFSILIIGRSMKAFLPVAGSTSPFLGSAQVGEAVFAMCICLSFILWALSTTWLGFALLGIQHVLRRTRVPFQLSFWGMIFPNVSDGTSPLSVDPLDESTRRVYTQS
jgi:tellurite resistance protein TehA-like permease